MTLRHFLTHRLPWTQGALAVGALAVATGALTMARTNGIVGASASAASARPLPVATVAVASAPSHLERRFHTGEVRARRTADLGVQVGGRLISILAPEGAELAAGDPVAQLDVRRLETLRSEIAARRGEALARLDEMLAGPRTEVIEAARATARGLEQDLALAALKTERRAQLLEHDAVSAEESDEATFRERSLSARLAAARAELDELENGTRPEHVRAQRSQLERLDAELEQLEIDIEDSVLRAPFAGTVATHLEDPGAVLAVGQPVVRLVESGALEAWVGLPPAVARDLPGRTFALELVGRPLDAVLRALLPELDPATRTRAAVFELAPGSAVPGQTVRLAVETEVVGRGFWLPISALVESTRGLWSAYAVVEEGGARVVERRELELLHTDGNRAFVRGTLFDGDLVVMRGVHRLVPGQAVELAAPTPGAGPFAALAGE